MNHYALDHHEQKDRIGTSFVDLQLGGTRNIAPNPIMNWLSVPFPSFLLFFFVSFAFSDFHLYSNSANAFPRADLLFQGGLNLQIEHHLFPTIPRNNLLAVRPLVQQFCKEQNIPYLELSYWDCLMEVERKLHRVSAAYLKQAKKTA